MKFLREANERRPGDFWIAFELAWACQTTKPPATDEAIRYYTAALMVRPNSTAAHINRGIALKDKSQLDDKGQLDEAIAEFRKALQIQPDNAYARNDLGTALRAKGQWDEAIAEYREALQIKPDYADAHYNLGIALKDKCVPGVPLVHESDGHYNLGSALKDRGAILRTAASDWAAGSARR